MGSLSSVQNLILLPSCSLQIDQIHLRIIQGSVNVLIKIGIEEESAKKGHSRLIGHWESTWLYYFLIQDILL